MGKIKRFFAKANVGTVTSTEDVGGSRSDGVVWGREDRVSNAKGQRLGQVDASGRHSPAVSQQQQQQRISGI